MAFDISVLLNFPRTEKVADAFVAYHAAHGMSFSKLIGQPSRRNQYVASELPPDFWQEPNTGVVMLRPYFMRVDRVDTAGANSYINKDGLITGGTTLYADPNESLLSFNLSSQGPTSVAQAIMAGLKTGTDVRKDLTGLPPSILNWRDQFAPDFVWNIQTAAPLAPNQSFQYTCNPNGIFTDFSGTYKALSFGNGRFILEIQMWGSVYLYGWNGVAWQTLLDVTTGQVGIDAHTPFTVSVTPFSRRFLSVTFGQAGASAGSPHAGKAPAYNQSRPVAQFLVILRGGAFEPQYDVSLGQYVKTPAGQVYILLKKTGVRYDFALAKGLYPTGTTTLSLAPETMDHAPTWDPNFTTTGLKINGIDGQREPSAGAASTLTTFLRDIHGDPYTTTPAPGVPPDPKKKIVVAEVSFTPSHGGIYSPELHSASIKHEAHVQTSAFTPVDLSTEWQLIRFQRTTAAEVSRIEIKLREDSRWQELLKSDGPFRITGKDNSGNVRTIADGYLRRKQIGREGPSQLATNQGEGLDMGFRLDSASFTPEAVEGSEIADTIRKAIIDAGFAPNEVWVDYEGSPQLRDMTFGLLRNPSDVLRPNEDTSVGAFVRNCVEKYGAQARPGLRVRWVKAPAGMTPPTGNLWKIYLGPVYDSTAGPDCYFTFDSSIIPLLGTFATETERYLGRVYRAHGTQEPTTLQPEFNAVRARAAADVTGHDANPERFIDAEDRVLNDPTYVGYEGAIVVKPLSPSDLPGVTSADDLEKQIRHYFDVHYNLKSLRTQEFSGEWQDETDVDQFAVVLGLAPKNDPDGRFVKGDPISYGVYRIDFIDVEIRHDGPGPSGATRRWEREGSYKLVFVDKWEKLTGGTPIKMFAPDGLLPL